MSCECGTRHWECPCVKESESDYLDGRHAALDEILEFIEAHENSELTADDIYKEALSLRTAWNKKRADELFERWANGRTQRVF